MPYAKSFSCSLTIYPDFHKDQYFDYIKERINKWISQCFITYNSLFEISVVQHSMEIYKYDSSVDKKDIVFKKLWGNPYATYTIYISGAGMIHKGISEESIKPPINLAENLINTVTFKYIEISDMSHPSIIAFGRGIGIPVKYNSNTTEDWGIGFNEEDGYSPNWKLSIDCSKKHFNDVYNIVSDIMKYNKNEEYSIEADHYDGNICVETSFLLSNKNKVGYFKLLNTLSSLVIIDDEITINECSMNFIPQNEKVFSIESYYFDEISGRFIIKNILI